MAKAKTKTPKKQNGSAANLGFEAQLWQAADALRNNMDAAEYKHVVLGLIFLKYISDAFEEQHAKLEAERKQGADPEDADEYRAAHIFWVPKEARWSKLKAIAPQPTIGKVVDDAMVAIERDNPSLKGVLPKDYARPGLDKERLGQLINLVSNIDFRRPSPQPSPSGRGSKPQYRGGYDFSGLADRARELRKKQTPAEELLWQLLRDRQFCDTKFRRQHQIGDYLCDFYCHDAKLVVECDGDPHENFSHIKHDTKRDAYFRSLGLRVLRFKNKRVLNDTEAVLAEIASALPSPTGRGAGGAGGQEIHGKSFDLLGRVYEYFLSMFASAEGKKGGQFYTPRCVVRILVEMLAPYKGRVYDPCCGSGGMFVSSEKFIEAHGGAIGQISIYGQESNYTTWRLAKMNLALRGIDAQIAHGDTFHNHQHPDLKADYVLANPPFNDSDWRGELLKDDKRWKYGTPPAGNANFAWVQHFIYHLAPNGIAGFVLANGSMSSNQSGEGEIRKAIIEADLVDCMVAMPGQLFYSTQIPVCLWFIARNKSGQPSPRPGGHPSPTGRGGEGEGYRDRRGSVLFIDARKLGSMIDRVHRELTDEDIAKIAGTYHLWRGDPHPIPLPVGEGEKQYRGGFDFSGLVQTARELRKKQTPAEAVMWELLRDRRFMNLKFRRQHQIGEYVVDFYCDEHKLAVELDGPVHDEARQAKKDKTRDAYLQSLGLTVLRLRNEEFLADPEAGLKKVASVLPSSSGRGAGGEGVAVYRDIPGFCKAAKLDEIRKHGHVLTPGRYVGAEAVEDDGEPFEEKMRRLTVRLEEQFAESAKLEKQIRQNLKGLAHD